MKIKQVCLTVTFCIFGCSLAAQTGEHKYPDCFCTDRNGERIELGVVMCMSVDGRQYLARCEMALNNPFWREIDESCPNV
ncbi:MAG: hypothetical protein AAFR98_03345 [Pseudomonadota bacterium]